MSESTGQETKNKLSMVVLSGDMDKVMSAYIIATGAAAGGMEVVMFHTFWGFKAIQAKGLTGKSLMGRLLGLMNRGGLNAIGPSRLNFGGLGRWMFKRMMKAKGVASLPELQQMAIEMGVRILPCEMTMRMMEVDVKDLIPAAEAPVGVATFIQHASESKVTLFI
jgi:peroxiredoxin family protein